MPGYSQMSTKELLEELKRLKAQLKDPSIKVIESIDVEKRIHHIGVIITRRQEKT